MAEPFKFLSQAEFEALSPTEKLAYLSDAMEELQRGKRSTQDRGWDGQKDPGNTHFGRIEESASIETSIVCVQ